jgi:triacylglycerol lipase
MSSCPMYFPEGFDLEEAFLLSELVSTAYDMQSQWKEQGKPKPEDFQWIPKGPNLNYSKPIWGADRLLYFFLEHEPYAFVATSPDGTGYLVFRGTDSDADWVENLKFDQDEYAFAPGFGKTNQGFTGVYSSMREDILHVLSGAPSIKKLLITGHSLGSALSTLAVPDLCANLARSEDFKMIHCNFASPRTGDQAFVAAYNRCGVPTFRLVNTCDIVPTVPASVLTFDLPIYSHVGTSVDFTAQYGSIPANHSVSTCYGYALEHPHQPEA